MDFWFVTQGLLDLVLISLIILVFARLTKSPKDDPRMSKGLQLLQSKIAILEDLSDRTDHQVSQLVKILEQKIREIQLGIQDSENQIQKIHHQTQKSLEVAKIFQDKLPHEEIIERKNTIKYVRAARMAHQGQSIEEIVKEVGLSRAEAELICKMNREQLVFSEEELPEWANEGVAPPKETCQVNLHEAFHVPAEDVQSLKRLGEAFKKACELDQIISEKEKPSNAKSEQDEKVQPYIFRKIDPRQIIS